MIDKENPCAKAVDPRFTAFVNAITPYNYASQFSEDSLLESIFLRIGEANRWVVECGAGCGLFMSNSRRLIEAGWNAILIEGDEKQWKLLDAQPARSNVERIYAQIDLGENRIENYLVGRLIPQDFDLLVIDIDSQDYWVVNSLARYHPRVLMVEYDPNADADFIPEPNGPGQAGLNAIIKLGCGKLYTPICRTWCNVIFVRNDLAPMLMERPTLAQELGISDDKAEKAARIVDTGMYAYVQQESDPPQSIKMRPGKHLELIHCDRCDQEILTSSLFADKEGRKYCTYCATAIEFGTLSRERIIPQPKDHSNEDAIAYERIAQSKNGDLIPVSDRVMKELKDIPGGQIYRNVPSDKKIVKVAAAMSTPRLGFLSNSDCILASLAQFNIPLARGEGAFWSASLSRSIERCLDHKPDYVLTIDYDTAFHSSDVAKLLCFLDDNPGIDVAVPLQMKREGGELLASTDGAADLGQAGIQIQQGHFGLTLFRSSVFERLGLPWFYERPGPDGRWNEGRTDADMGFWKNCRDHGVSVYLVLGIVVGHLELVVTWPDQQLKTHYQSMNGWRDNQMKAPEIAFTRDRIQETIEHSRKLEMKD